MMKESTSKYESLADKDEDEYIDGGVSQSTQKRKDLLRIIFWVEVANLLIFTLLYSLWTVVIHIRVKGSPIFVRSRSALTMDGTDDRPLQYNVTTTFTVDKTNLTLIKLGPTGDNYWMNITFHSNNGLVAVSDAFASKHGSHLSKLPAPEGQTVLQVDVFHQLHCLERIRGEIASAKYIYQLNPNRTEDDPFTKHTFHCIDYLRQALICQADMTLVSTTNDLEFDHAPPRQCRDFNAVRQWVMDRRYDYNKWLNGIDSEMGQKLGTKSVPL
jgi:hypothetical protein